jgi:hypothetical protein
MDDVLCASRIVSLDTNDGTAQYCALDILDIQIVFRHLFHGVRRHVVLSKSYLISDAVDPATWHVAHQNMMLKAHFSLWFLARSTPLLDDRLRSGRALQLDQGAKQRPDEWLFLCCWDFWSLKLIGWSRLSDHAALLHCLGPGQSMGLLITQLPVIGVALTDARHLAHARRLGGELRQAQQMSQEAGDLALLVTAQRKTQDTIAGIPQSPVPEAHVNGHEGRLTQLAQDRGNPLVLDYLAWAKIAETLRPRPLRQSSPYRYVCQLVIKNDLTHAVTEKAC